MQNDLPTTRLEGCGTRYCVQLEYPPVFGGSVLGYCSENISMPRVAGDEISICDIEACVRLRPVGTQRPVKPMFVERIERCVTSEVMAATASCTCALKSPTGTLVEYISLEYS